MNKDLENEHKKRRNQEGITLIALVITIILLLILAGVIINLAIGENGIIKTASKGTDAYKIASIKETVEQEILALDIEKITKGKKLTVEQALIGLQENQTFEEIDLSEQTGICEGYVIGLGYNENGKVVILSVEKDVGTRLDISYNPTGYTNGNVAVRITLKSSTANITNIEVPQEMTKKEDGLYEVTKNGTYTVKATLDNGETLEKEITVGNIDKLAPKDFTPEVIDNNIKSITIYSKTEDCESTDISVCSGILKYEYYIANNIYETTQNSIIIDTLTAGVEYNVYVIAYDNAGNMTKSENITLTPINVLEINNLEELKQFRDDVNNGNNYSGVTIKLMVDIDLSGDENDESTWWTPIGTTNYFRGTFEGNNHIISNLYINDNVDNASAAGFFAYVSGAIINDVTIKDGYVYNYNSMVGMLIGKAMWETYISNCIIQGGNVVGNRGGTVIGAGGLVGYSYGTVYMSNCMNASSVTSNSQTGGLIGASDASISHIENSVNIGEVVCTATSNFYAAGILGSTMSNSSAQISNCYNTGGVYNQNGKAAGILSNSIGTSSTIINCYNVGDLSGKTVGGIAVTYEKGTLSNNYWLSGCGATYGIYATSSNEGATSKTSAQLKGLYSTLGSEFAKDSSGINNGYPILKWQLNSD